MHEPSTPPLPPERRSPPARLLPRPPGVALPLPRRLPLLILILIRLRARILLIPVLPLRVWLGQRGQGLPVWRILEGVANQEVLARVPAARTLKGGKCGEGRHAMSSREAGRRHARCQLARMVSAARTVPAARAVRTACGGRWHRKIGATARCVPTFAGSPRACGCTLASARPPWPHSCGGRPGGQCSRSRWWQTGRSWGRATAGAGRQVEVHAWRVEA